MSYGNKFFIADDTIKHLDVIVYNTSDSFLKTRYVGLLAVAAVCSYELTLKDTFIEFAEKKNKVLGNFSAEYFSRINGRIKTSIIKDEYLPKFGEKYLKRFKKKREKQEIITLRDTGKSITTSYNNIIEWRNQFAHQGTLPQYVTYEDAKSAYEAGKEILRILNETMRY